MQHESMDEESLGSVSLVVGSVNFLFCDDVLLGGKHIELSVVEDLVGVGELLEAIFVALLLVCLLFEDESFFSKSALKLSWLGVEMIIKSHLLAQVAHLP